jgi:GTP cyclohydrolase I
MYARRLQVQERLCAQIADAVEKVLRPKGVAVQMSGVHMCMVCRGVRNASASTTTACMRGVYKEDARMRHEFMTLSSQRTALL